MSVPPALLRVLAAVAMAAALTGGVVPAAPTARAEPEPAVPATSGAVAEPTDDDTSDTGDASEDPDDQDAADDYDAPLEVTIDGLTPGVLPRTGPLVVEGTVTNVDLETWQDVRIYPLFGAGPDCDFCGEVMTTSAQLELAADTDPEAPVGDRYAEDEAVRASIASLEPGGSATFSIRIPQAVLRELFGTPAAGVYWFGVQALGESDSSPRDLLSDGRARTFLPYLPDRIAQDPDRVVPTAIVLPLRHRIAYDADGSVADTEEWATAVGQEGDLGGPLAFGAAAGPTPLTWLVDPAVPDAVRALAQGNPPRAIVPAGPAPGESPTADPSGDGEGEDGEDGEDGGDDGSDEGGEPDPDDPIVAAARSWLELLEPELTGDDVALLPYGDPDLAALGEAMPSLYPTAREHVADVLTDWEVEGLPVVGSSDGYLDVSGILAVDDDATLLLGDRMFPTETFSAEPPSDGLVDQRPVVVTSTETASGGPGPEPRLSSTALRQRILSEATVRAIRARDGDARPLVVVLPPGLVTTGAAKFWSGLDVDGIQLVELSDLATPSSDPAVPDSGRQIDPAELTYPVSEDDEELSGSVVAEASRLIRAAGTLQDVLGEGFLVRDQLVGEALTGTSYAVRGDSGAEDRLTAARQWVQDQLAGITIDAPAGVTLSGESGSFNVAVSNSLDHAVTVRIVASTDDSGAAVEVADSVTLAPHSRSSVPVQADTSRPGVHNVTLQLTDSAGNSLGGTDTLPLRTGQVSIVIWAIMGSGVAILLVAIGIRLFRRVRRARAGAGAAA
ncbi:DUF6049 family protein [Nocardioides caeni]|uniref:Uncharacterized protein n=1 Tax=Nocardioides caeni TaxID=574700 RepID=A0A4S8N2F9_9ACTN|nr:DUF6049 family protein [Nocardioides caeni]THV10118.1 hypothetical protein E9934_15005 [Nocardioides caeni]